MFVSAHGLCRDREGNFWAGDSGPFGDSAATAGRGFQVFKFSPDGKLLLTLGKAGVSKAGPDTFVGPTSCAILGNGDIIIGDGHWPRPASAQQDGDRLVPVHGGREVRPRLREARDRSHGVHGSPRAGHRLARPALRSRSIEQPLPIFDKDMNYLDSWKHFGRPSGVSILKDDTLVVADSESGISLARTQGLARGRRADVQERGLAAGDQDR